MQRPLCVFFKLISQSKVATLASGEPTEKRHDYAEAALPTLSPSRLLYVTDKRNKCKYLIDTGAAVSVLPMSCANRTTDTTSLPLVAADNTTITTYGTSKRIVDVDLKRDYAWTFIVGLVDIKQFRSRFSYTLQLTGRFERSMFERYDNRFSYTSYPIIYKAIVP